MEALHGILLHIDSTTASWQNPTKRSAQWKNNVFSFGWKQDPLRAVAKTRFYTLQTSLWKTDETHKESHVKLHAQDDVKNEGALNPFW